MNFGAGDFSLKMNLNQRDEMQIEDQNKSNPHNNFLMHFVAEEKTFTQQSSWGQRNFNGMKSGLFSSLPPSGQNKEYYEKWEKNIRLEEATDKNDPIQKVFVEGVSTVLFDTFSVIFQRKFDKRLQAKEFLSIARNLSTVRCVSQSQALPWQYNGTVTEVNSEERLGMISCYVEIKFPFDRFREIENYIKENETDWSIEEIKLSFYQQMRSNMMNLRLSPKHEEIIVQKAEPKIGLRMDDETEVLYEIFVENNEELNNDQKLAIKNCLASRNYNLVLGMPGTGKTHVIVILLKILIECQKKVLVTTHTHSALDNILKRFVEEFPEDRRKVLRVGSEDKIDQEILDLAHFGSFIDYGKMIFAVTCLGVNNKTLRGMNFATCIVDEASQIVEPVVIGPLLKTEHFVLFGDHNQLCPLVKSEEAKEGGMGISLFEKLASEHINSISYLTIQYRMNENLMRFSNQVIYNNRMKCANEQVKTGQIQLKLKENEEIEWVKNILDPRRSVVFLDLGDVRALHDEDSRNLNCSLACFLTRELESHGVEEEDIGIISPLRDDRNAMNILLKDLPKVNRYTIDTCQGINKNCIIMNIGLDTTRVRSLLASLKRVNVAFTRAKHKLIIIGLLNELREMEGIGSFIKQLDSEKDRELFDYKMLQEAGILV